MSHVYHVIPTDRPGMNHEQFLSRTIVGTVLGLFTAILSAFKTGSFWALLTADNMQQLITNLGLITSFIGGTIYAAMNLYFWIQIQQAITAKKLADIAAGKAADAVAAQVKDQVATAVKLMSDDDTPAYKGPATGESYKPRGGSNMRDVQS